MSRIGKQPIAIPAGVTVTANGNQVAVKGKLGVTLLTRHPRPQGEGVVTDNPGNIIPASQWKPVANQAQVPLRGVRLDGGVFETAVRNNIGYLPNVLWIGGASLFALLYAIFRGRTGPAGRPRR